MPVRSTANEPSWTSATRLLRAGCLASAGSLLVFALAGCHGGAQTDIVEREMRWQEDQIYAMEDYLTEYQQLLCQYRAENSALKRQLSHGSFKQRPDARVRREEEKIQDTQEIIRELEPPMAPPLMETMPSGVAPPSPQSQDQVPNLDFRPARRQTPGVRRTALERPRDESSVEPNVLPIESPENAQPIDLEEAFAADESITSDEAQEVLNPEESSRSIEPLEYVMVRGDVLPDDGQSGPRMLVDVEPLGAGGGPAAFEGELSLMILDVGGETPRGVARWDFTPEQLIELLGEEAGPAMQFPLQLPADTPIDGQLQIWARLVPVDGEKLLANADLNLQHAGPFSSVRPQVVVVEEPVVDIEPAEEFLDEPIVVAESDSLSVGEWNGWQVAEPGQHAASARNQQPPASQWRKATHPLPTKVNHGRPVVATAVPEKPAVDERLARRDKAADVERPSWSPDRNGRSSIKPAAKLAPPAWSPER